MDFLSGVTLFALDIRMWSGATTAERDDIKLGTGGEIPPPEILALGRKRLIAPESLRPFKTIKKRVERSMLLDGTRFIGGYAIPDPLSDEKEVWLKEQRDEYDQAIATFMSEFDERLADWRARNQDYAYAFQQHIGRESIERRFGFTIDAYKLEAQPGNQTGEEQVAATILREVGATCREISDRLSDRKNGIRRESLVDQLTPIRQKLKSLAFGNGRLLHLVREFDALEQHIPDTLLKPDAVEIKHVMAFMSMLGDDARVEDIFDGSFSVADLFNWKPLVSASPRPVASPPLAFV